MEAVEYEQALEQCWREAQGAMADERPIPSPSFRHNFKNAYKIGQQHASREEADRTMIAAMAMQAMLSNPSIYHAYCDNIVTNAAISLTKKAVEVADALIKELKNNQDLGIE